MSSKSQQPISPGSDDIDEKKRKRKASNRESARKSRLRKQQRVEELLTQENQLKEEMKKLRLTIDNVNQLYLNVASDNNVLRAQLAELTDRLKSLNSVIEIAYDRSGLAFDSPDTLMEPWQLDTLMEPWQLPYPNQSIPANEGLWL